MGNNSLQTTEKNLRSIAKRYENVKYSVGLAVLFLMKGTSAFSDGNIIQEAEKQKDILTDIKKEIRLERILKRFLLKKININLLL